MSGKTAFSGKFLTPAVVAGRSNILTVRSTLFFLRNFISFHSIQQFLSTKYHSVAWLLNAGGCNPAAFDVKLPFTRWELTNGAGLCCVTWRHAEIPQYRSTLQHGFNADYLEIAVPPRVTRLQREVKRCDVPSLAAVPCRNFSAPDLYCFIMRYSGKHSTEVTAQ